MSTDIYLSTTSSSVAVAPVKKKKLTHDFKDGRGRVPAHRHENGGGWVEDTAHVAPTVFVAKRAAVYHVAKVDGAISLRGHAKICGAADIAGDGEISDNAYIAGKTSAAGGTLCICGFARLYGGSLVGNVTITQNARVQGNPVIKNSTLNNECFIAGRAEIKNANIRDSAMVGGHARIHGGVIGGNTVVAGHAFVLDSATRHYAGQGLPEDELTRMRIVGDSNIVHVEDLAALLHIDGALIVGGTIRFSPYIADGAPTVIECGPQVCLARPEIHSYGDMDLAINARRTAAAGAVPTGPAFDLNNLVPKRRLSPVDA